MFPVSDMAMPLADSNGVDPLLLSVFSEENGGPHSMLEAPALFSPHQPVAASAPAPPVSFLDFSPPSPSDEDGTADLNDDHTISANSSIDSLFDLEYASTVSAATAATTPSTVTSATTKQSTVAPHFDDATSTPRKASTPVAAALYAKSTSKAISGPPKSVSSPVTPAPEQASSGKKNESPKMPTTTAVPFNGGGKPSTPALPSKAPASTAEPTAADAPSRRYKITQPSKFCHVCVRSGELVTLAPCANVLSGVCRKAICLRCFEKHGRRHEWEHARENTAILAKATAAAGPSPPKMPESAWTCLHCRNLCPENAQCKIYARTNRRRHLLLKQRKAEKARGPNADVVRGISAAGIRKPVSGGAVVRPQATASLANQMLVSQSRGRMNGFGAHPPTHAHGNSHSISQHPPHVLPVHHQHLTQPQQVRHTPQHHQQAHPPQHQHLHQTNQHPHMPQSLTGGAARGPGRMY